MNYKFDSKTELRKYLKGRTINDIEFGGEPSTPLTDEREITLHLDRSESVTIAATTYQTIEVTG
jgi:hypothetical protein